MTNTSPSRQLTKRRNPGVKLSNVFLGDKTHYRIAAGVTSWATLAWFVLGIAAWPATTPPSWYLLPLCAGFGLVFWFTTGWLGLH